MAWCECAPAIVAEMSDWVKLGGGNSGCCGNALHTYGFHLPANALPSSDYSLRHDTGPVLNGSWACAGDFSHDGNARLRGMHLTLLTRLMTGDPKLNMICEMITMPWANRPVYYWARWDGFTNLRKYTGQGHDTWSHISWYRHQADQRAYLWTTGGTPTPAPSVVVTAAPAYPGYLLVENNTKVDNNVRTWQARMAQRGWTIAVDGVFGPQTRSVCVKFQREKGLEVDGIVGPHTWAAAWTMPVT